MSSLVVEVCQVDKIEPHPNAERMRVATVKGWKTCVAYDPVADKCQFQEGQKCIFFPPDSILPPALCHGPGDTPPGRLNNLKYLHALPKDEFGVRPPGGRVVACRLRGHVSYGVIMNLDASFGDLDWDVGTDVAEHFGITKYEPPIESNDGDAAKPNSRFYKYTGIENFGNYPEAIPSDTEVIITEKIHGKNCRAGLVLDANEEGAATWVYMAGSHDLARKEFSRVETRFRVSELIEAGVFGPLVQGQEPSVGQVFLHNARYWQIDSLFTQTVKVPVDKEATPIEFKEEEVLKCQCFEVRPTDPTAIEWETVWRRSEFWESLTDQTKALLEHIRDVLPWPEPKHSIILYGELFGAGVQDMQYGLTGRSFRAFDISINNQYLDFDLKTELLSRFGVLSVPILYRGPFSIPILENYTSGPTTLCGPKEAGSFKGREGVVCTPVKEVSYCPVLNGRRIVKSVSADYHARKDGTEFH